MGVQPGGMGRVDPPGSASKVELNGAELIVKIESVEHNENDDCYFVKCVYPDGMVKNHQLLEGDPLSKVVVFMTQVFRNRYKKEVQVVKNVEEGDEQVEFKEIMNGQ